MTNAKPNPVRSALAGAAGVGLLMVNDVSPTTSGYFGRPMTPMSYAGVARRTTRRKAYGVGAFGGYRGYGDGAGNCVQFVDVYGRLVTQGLHAANRRAGSDSQSGHLIRLVASTGSPLGL